MKLSIFIIIAALLCGSILGYFSRLAVVSDLTVILPYQPTIVGGLAILGALIAYVSAAHMADTHLKIAEKNLRQQKEQSAEVIFNKKREIALLAQILITEIFIMIARGYLVHKNIIKPIRPWIII